MDIVTMFNGLASCNLCMDLPHPQWAGQFNVVTIADQLANMDVVNMFNGLASCNLTIDQPSQTVYLVSQWLASDAHLCH
jgi:hypothetical protein